MRDNESHIIDEILNGRTFRYEYFVGTYSRQVFATIVRIIDKPEDAEELTQDVFMKAFENLSSFNGKSTFATLPTIRPFRLHAGRCLLSRLSTTGS